MPGPGKYDIGADEYTVPLGPPMSGTYTVKHGGGDDFGSISQALGALAIRGFGGDVQFDVYSGTYVGMYVLTGLANGNYWVKFRGVPGENPVLDAGGNRYNWYMIANKRVRIEGFTMTGATSYGLYMYADTATPPYNGCDSCVIRNNTIYAPHGLYLAYSDYDTIDGNTINATSSYGIYLYGHSTPGQYSVRNVVSNNEVSGFSGHGVHTYCQDGLNIRGNVVTGPIPIYVDHGNYDTIANNYCHGNGGNYGMYIYGNSASPYSQGFVIANNMLDNNSYGMVVQYTQGCKVLYNSTQPSSSGYCGLYCYGNCAMEIRDNILTAAAGGCPLSFYLGDYTENYNDLWVYDGGPTVTNHSLCGGMDLAALKSTSGKGTGSISVDPEFTSATDCHLLGTSPCINAGDTVAGFLYDYDGDSRRSNTPDIGADEWVPTALDAGITRIEQGASIRPNPLTDGFAVLRYGLPKAGAAELAVYNVAGQRVLAQTFAAGRSGSVSLDLRRLSNGVYIVKFSSEGFAGSQKLVVQR